MPATDATSGNVRGFWGGVAGSAEAAGSRATASAIRATSLGRFVAPYAIPARAGETAASGASNPTDRVHPRACGGNATGFLGKMQSVGPSPRVRGKRSRYSASDSVMPVHPRACGGNGGRGPDDRGYPGPSPRVRGKLPRCLASEYRWRSIPARAGETLRVYSFLYLLRVHPRACGGNRPSPEWTGLRRGPSPRVRGKLR